MLDFYQGNLDSRGQAVLLKAHVAAVASRHYSSGRRDVLIVLLVSSREFIVFSIH
jgi:hypothetical protein